MLIYKENLLTLVAVKRFLILQASSYSHKILKNLFLGARVLGAHTGIPVSKSPWIHPWFVEGICLVLNVLFLNLFNKTYRHLKSHIGHILNNQIRHDWFQVSIVIKITNYK